MSGLPTAAEAARGWHDAAQAAGTLAQVYARLTPVLAAAMRASMRATWLDDVTWPWPTWVPRARPFDYERDCPGCAGAGGSLAVDTAEGWNR
jgi:hypothetical protein